MVNGPESVLGSVRVLTAVMKLSGASADLREVLAVKAVDADNNSIAGVTVNPSTVEVTIPIRKTKTVRIEPVMVGQPAADWEITETSLQGYHPYIRRRNGAAVNRINKNRTGFTGRHGQKHQHQRKVNNAGRSCAG